MTMDKVSPKKGRRWLKVLAACAAVVVGLGAFAEFGYHTYFGKRVFNALTVRAEGEDGNQTQFAKLMGRARKALAQNHPKLAIIFLKNALSMAPNNAEAHLQLGVALLKVGDAASAERELRSARQHGASNEQVLPVLFATMLRRSEGRRLLAQFPAPAEGDTSTLASETLRARALALAQIGNSEEAAAALDRALSFDKSAANLLARARLARSMGDTSLAVKLVDETLSKSPKNIEALLTKVDLLVRTKQVDKALAVANELVKFYPKNPQALLTRAGVYLQLQEHGKAMVDIDASLKAAPHMALGIYYKALAMEQAKDVKGAWDLAQSLPPTFLNARAEIGLAVSQMAIEAGQVETGTSILASTVSNFPKNVIARVRLASRYLKLKSADRAIEALRPMANSSDPRILVLLAQAYDMQHQYAKSIEYLEKVEGTGASNDILKRQIGIANLRAGKLNAGIKELEKLNAATPGDAQTAGVLIAALMHKNDYASALGVAKKLAAAAPKKPYGPFYQGELLLRRRDLDGAVSSFSRAIERDKKFVPAIYGRAVALAARGDLKAADADLRSILSNNPKNIPAQIKLAEIAIQAGEKDKATALLKQAATANPKEALPALALARLEMQQGHLDKAAAVVESFLNKVPNNASALAMQGEIQLAAGKTGQAVITFRSLANTYPKSLQIQTLLAGALIKSGDAKGAITTVRQLVNTYPKSLQVQLLLANVLAKGGDSEGAMRAYRKAVQMAPKAPAIHIALINFALANKNDTVAVTAARSYADQLPGPASAIILARTYAALNRIGDAVKVLTNSQAKYPNNRTLLSLTAMLRQQGEVKKSDAMMTNWIAKHPTDVAVRMTYAATQLTISPTVAETQYRAVLKLKPYNLTALNNLGWLLQQKDPKEALVYSERAAKIAPNSPSVLDTLAWTKWKLNDKSGALGLLQRAHSIDSKNGEITYHLAVALDGNGRHADAKKMLADLLASKVEFPEKKAAEALYVQWR